MRTAQIFTGKEFIDVQEGSSFRINGVWNFDIGSAVTFNVKSGIDVETIVKMKDGTGTEFLVTHINADDEYANMEVEAEDVNVEVSEYSELPKFTKTKFTKKEIIDFINENNIDVDIKSNMSKADIVSSLKEMGVM